MTSALRAAGTEDYRRQLTRISSRPPLPDEIRHLKMPRSEYVREMEIVDVGAEERPVTYVKTAFRSARIRFVLET